MREINGHLTNVSRRKAGWLFTHLKGYFCFFSHQSVAGERGVINYIITWQSGYVNLRGCMVSEV